MNNRRNYYRILQVQPDAPAEIIHACYRTLMHKLKQHPDYGGAHWNAAIINEAYETLSNSDKRFEYEKRLFERYTKQQFPDKDYIRYPVISIFCPFCKRPLARKANPGENCASCRSPLQSKSTGELLKQEYQRSANRIKKSGSILYYSSWPQKGKEAKIIDLSPQGIRFLCFEKLEHEAIIKIRSPLLNAIAKVTNTQNKEAGRDPAYSVGTRFLAVTFANSKGSFLSTIV